MIGMWDKGFYKRLWSAVFAMGSALLMLLPAHDVRGQTTQGDWYITWGYNRSVYAVSDVHMWGNSPNGAFDMTLENAEASDMPERFHAKVYFHPGLFTIPQFNARFGKKIADHTWITAGWDHMKYKLRKQWVNATGVAAASDFEPESQDDILRQWDGDSLYWGQTFNFEHSDGMNFVRFSYEREWPIWQSRQKHIGLVGMTALGTGIVVCSTDFRWADVRQKNAQHISGFGLSGHAGLRLHVHRRFFIQTTVQAGGVSLPWIRIQGATDAGADQRIAFIEGAFALGYSIGSSHQKNKRDCDSCPRW